VSGVMTSLTNFGYRWSMKLFMPDLAKQLAAQDALAWTVEVPDQITPELYMRVEDNGADLTIFAFSGLDILYAGLARFEFQRSLQKLGKTANFVFLRDIHRLGFHAMPDGSPGGLEFYREVIEETKEKLGAKHNIAIGSSIGGSVAFYMGTKCKFDQVVIFGAAFTLHCFTNPKMMLKTLFDFPKLFKEPGAYIEMIVVTFAAIWATTALSRRFGAENVGKPLEEYAKAEYKPHITLHYGESAWPDAAQAKMLGEFKETTIIPLPTGRHNTPEFLKQRGELHQYITAALGRAGVDVDDALPAEASAQ